MRADRLIAVILHLQRHGRTTAARLAAATGVSVATARRDLEALAAAGVPVWSQPGRGGGWALVGGARTDLSGLTEPEVRALFLALGRAVGPQGAASAALGKLVRALPAPFRQEAETALRAVLRDDRPWGASARDVPAALAPLQDAVVRSRAASILYTTADADAVPRRRTVHPWGVVEKAGVAYLVAGTTHGPRTFRVDRVSSVDVGAEPAQRPPDLDLEAAWRSTVAAVERHRTSVTARVRVAERVRGPFLEVLGPAAVPTDDDDVLEVGAHTLRGLAEQLAGWGDAVRVLGPGQLRAELRALAAELLAAHAEPDAGA